MEKGEKLNHDASSHFCGRCSLPEKLDNILCMMLLVTCLSQIAVRPNS